MDPHLRFLHECDNDVTYMWHLHDSYEHIGNVHSFILQLSMFPHGNMKNEGKVGNLWTWKMMGMGECVNMGMNKSKHFGDVGNGN
jgi:hypothetical protein